MLTKENWGAGAKPPENVGTTPFQTKENTLSDIKRTLQKGHFHSLAEKGRVQTPRTP